MEGTRELPRRRRGGRTWLWPERVSWANLESGFELFARLSDLERSIRAADLVITGEGAIDRSTLMGKGVGRVAGLCKRLRVPCIGLAGAMTGQAHKRQTFHRIQALTELAPLEACKAEAAYWLEKLALQVAAEFK